MAAIHMSSIVTCHNVSLAFEPGRPVLQDVQFSLAPGSFHFLTGPSGAGKSSLLKLLYLSERPSGGHITMFGEKVDELPKSELPYIRRRIGVVFQDFRLLRHLTALDNVALPLRLAGGKKKNIIHQVKELLSWVGLEDRMEALPDTLSGGEQQRVAIARAIVTKPSLLVADEPTGNVDDKMAVRLMRLFEELNKMGTAVLIATHNEPLIQRFQHPVLYLEQGRLTVSREKAA
jgi:cell division transport system ATP-binding protein